MEKIDLCNEINTMNVQIGVDDSFKVISDTVRYEQMLINPYTAKCCGFSIKALIPFDNVSKIVTQVITNRGSVNPIRFSPETLDKISMVTKLSNKFIEYVPKAVAEIIKNLKSGKFTHCNECDELSFPFIFNINNPIYNCSCRDINISFTMDDRLHTVNTEAVSVDNGAAPLLTGVTFTIGNCKPVNIDVDSDKLYDHIDEVFMSLYCKLHTFIDKAKRN